MATQVSLNDGAVASAGALAIQTNGTTQAVSISTGQVATLAQNPILTSGTANGVAYLNGTRVVTTGSALTFDGTNLGVGGSSSYKLGVTGSSNNATSGAIQTVNSNVGTSTQTGLWASNGTQSAQFSLAGTGYTAYGAYAAGNVVIYNDQAITLMADNPSTGVIKFAAGGNTEGMRLTSTGLGIGTSSPSYKLHVRGADATATLVVGNTTEGTQLEVLTYQDDKVVLRSIDSSSVARTIAFETGTSERARISSDGNLLVGATSGSGNRLDVVGGGIQVTASGTSFNLLNIKDSVDQSGATYVQFYNSAGGNIGNINRVTTTNAVVYNTTSDYRLKTVTGAVTGQGSRIDALKPIDYIWTDGGQQARGFLAHEFQTVYPNSVSGNKDAVDADGNPKYQAMQAATSEVIADLVAEIQSLRQRLSAANL